MVATRECPFAEELKNIGSNFMEKENSYGPCPPINLFPLIPRLEYAAVPMAKFTRALIDGGLVTLDAQLSAIAHL